MTIGNVKFTILAELNMPLSYSVPQGSPDYQNQEDQIELPQDEFEKTFAEPKVSTFLKILRFIYFIVFLGPIRYVLVFVWLFVYFLFVSVLPFFSKFFKHERAFKEWAAKIVNPLTRCILFTLGIVKIKVNGEFNKEARVLVCNHLSCIDIVVLLNQFPLSFVGMASLKKNPFILNTAKIFDVIFVDRSKQENASQQIVNAIRDPTLLPMMVFPEGKISNGGIVLGFRTGAFIEKCVIQPVTLTYHHYLCPKGMSTIAWTHDSFFFYLYQLLSTPFLTLTIDLLPAVYAKDESRSPKEVALETQLKMANHLGVPALKQTNKEIFQKKKVD